MCQLSISKLVNVQIFEFKVQSSKFNAGMHHMRPQRRQVSISCITL